MLQAPVEGGCADAKEDALHSIEKRCLSQFTDWDGARRVGRNTWSDESGVYHNSHFKRALYVPTDPLALRKCCLLPEHATSTQ